MTGPDFPLSDKYQVVSWAVPLRNNPSWLSTPLAETTDKTNPMTANGKDIIQGFRDMIKKLPSQKKCAMPNHPKNP